MFAVGLSFCDLAVLKPGVNITPTPTPTPSPAFTVQPSISGTPQVGVPYVGTPGTASNTTGHTYRWLLSTTSGGTYTAIVGATSTSYTPVSGDATKYLKFEDTATGPGGSTVATTTFAGPVAAAATINDPVTSNIVSGWTAGDNSPNWDTTYSGTYYDPSDYSGDGLRIRYKFAGAGSYTTMPWIPFDINATSGLHWLIDGPNYPFMTDGTLNAGGFFEVQVQAGRNFSGPIDGSAAATASLTSNWSNTWSDTLSAVAVSNWIYNAAPATQTFAFSAANPVTFAAQSFGTGTGIARVAYNGNPPAGVTIAGAAMTKLYEVTDGVNGISVWAKAGITSGAKDIVITPSGTAARTYNIATGTLSSAINPTPTASVNIAIGYNPDPQTPAAFTLPANGVALGIAGPFGNGVVPTWSLGTANAEAHGANGDFMFAAGSLLGGASSSSQQMAVSGFAYAGAGMLVVVWGP